jgi:hypothetical protein
MLVKLIPNFLIRYVIFPY